jgi:hypothetical protein
LTEPRPSRALTLNVVYYIAATIGSVWVVGMFVGPMLRQRATANVVIPPGTPPAETTALFQKAQAHVEWIEAGLISVSPFGGQIIPSERLVRNFYTNSRRPLWAFQAALIAGMFALAAVLLGLTVVTFDRCLGRVREHQIGHTPRSQVFAGWAVPTFSGSYDEKVGDAHPTGTHPPGRVRPPGP